MGPGVKMDGPERANDSIVVKDLVKVYKGGIRAVDGVSFEVKAGELFAFLGPNGAGKSTTIKILTTLLKPTSGTAEVLGMDVKTHSARVRSSIGYAAQEVGLTRTPRGGRTWCCMATSIVWTVRRFAAGWTSFST